MKKSVLNYGLVLGVVLCINMFVMVNLLYANPNLETNDILGYTVLVLIFSIIFFGVRHYRKQRATVAFSFGRAFRAGLYMALIASTLYVVTWLFYYYLFVPDFINVYTEHVLNQCTSETELAAKAKEMEQFAYMYENPLFVILITYFEVLPIGIAVALVSALLLKRKEPPPWDNW